MKVLSTKPVGNSGDTFKLKGRCTLLMADRVEAREGQLTIKFDKDTKKFKVLWFVLGVSITLCTRIISKTLYFDIQIHAIDSL